MSARPSPLTRRSFLSAAATLSAASKTLSKSNLPIEGDFPALNRATGWLNSPPLTPAGLRGKVVLVNFWTYSCINWIRSFPYVRAWAAKYKDDGLVVLGVHSPEFEFEKDIENVKQAVQDRGIDFPVAIDNNHAIWRAFSNSAWPALYFIDERGRIRHHYFGEGQYERSEAVIQSLLHKQGGLVSPNAQGDEAPADWTNLRSPENYLGNDRTLNFSKSSARLKLNHWSVAGQWTFGKQSILSTAPSSRIAYRFHARDLHLVMGSAARGATIPFRVLIDGKQPGEAARGTDVNAQGLGTLTGPRMYHLIRQQSPIAASLFEIEFSNPGVEAFSFTFG
jgi:thiol-disulfide isomerase/thioredoxin